MTSIQQFGNAKGSLGLLKVILQGTVRGCKNVDIWIKRVQTVFTARRYCMLARYMPCHVSVRLTACHTPVLCQNG